MGKFVSKELHDLLIKKQEELVEVLKEINDLLENYNVNKEQIEKLQVKRNKLQEEVKEIEKDIFSDM